MYNIQTINNKSKWESFIHEQSGKSTSPTSFIQSWNWGEFLTRQKQKIFRIGIFNDEKLIGVALGAKITARRGSYLHFRHGPVINWQNEELVKFVIENLKTLAKQEKVWFIRISPLIDIKNFPGRGQPLADKFQIRNSVPSSMHDVDAEETWVLDLKKSEEELLAEMRKNTRYSIRKATKEGVEIIKTRDNNYLKIFWEIFQDTVKRHKWTAYSFDYIKDEFETFTKDDQAIMLLAKYKEKFIAAAIFILYGDQSVYHHSGSLSEYQKIPASYLLQWEAIKEAKSRGFNKHNFWGLPLDNNNELEQNHPWTGLGRFKVGFGGRAEKWIHARDIPVSWKYWSTHYFEKLETKRKGY